MSPTNHQVRRFALGLVLLVLAVALLSHKSSEPVILRYSLAYLMFLALCAAAAGFVYFSFRRLGRRAWFLYAFFCLLGLAGCAVVEGIAHVYAYFHPSYAVLFVQPDENVGWKQVPNLRWTWAGQSFAAVDFSVPIVTNSHGFRDSQRQFDKPRGVTRIALLGDSFVEAAQVPLDKTAGQLLETKLNSGPNGTRYEVLNFGISNFGVGQSLLAWQHYAREFSPDYVFVYVAEMQMNRTVRRDALAQRREGLWVRPTFRLEGDRLIVVPPRDYEEFARLQSEIVQNEFGGKRQKRRRVGFFLGRLVRPLAARWTSLWTKKQESNQSTLEEGTLELNLKVIEELGRGVRASGGQLVVVDTVLYHDGAKQTSGTLKQFCSENFLGYLPLSDYLLEQNSKGVSTKWRHDRHFNHAGNTIFATAMYDWLIENSGSPREAVATEPGALTIPCPPLAATEKGRMASSK